MKVKISPLSKRFFIGLWITVLYVVCVFLVVYSLSTYQFQLKLNSIPYVKTDIDSLFIEHDCDLSGIQLDTSSAIVKVPCIPNHTTFKNEYYSPGKVLTIYKEIIELAGKNIGVLNKRKEDTAMSIRNLKQSLKDGTGDDNTLVNIENLEGNIFAIEKEIRDLVSKQKSDMEEHEALVETFSDIEYFENFFNIFSDKFGVKSFWAVPKPILELVLILSMGILGSLMFITIEFINSYNNEKEQFSMYLFRPSLGMIVALSVYVMVKSGQSAFGEGDSEYLSPFLISFLGIISGMLAEKAYRKLAITGGTVLNTTEDTNSS